MKDKLIEEYNKLMELLYKLRTESIDDPKAKTRYNQILESKKFQDLENSLIKLCSK